MSSQTSTPNTNTNSPSPTGTGIPLSINSSYRQYKADTNTVARWLTATAERCGFPIDNVIRPKEVQKEAAPASGKGKGKQKAKAKVILAVRDFVQLANYIAAATPAVPVAVPEGFTKILNRVIAVRRAHGEKVVETLALNEETEESTQRHDFFIGILEQVRDILQPLVVPGASRVQAQVQMKSGGRRGSAAVPGSRRGSTISMLGGRDSRRSSTVDSLANRFDGLDVQEPSKEFLEAPDVILPPTYREVEVDEADPDLQSVSDAVVKLNMLLKDFNKIRATVQSTWAGYRDGRFDLIAASLMTSTAMEMVRYLAEDVKPRFRVFSDQLQGILIDGGITLLGGRYRDECKKKKVDPLYRERPDDALNFQAWELCEDSHISIVTLLLAVLPDVIDMGTAAYAAGDYGTYDPSSDRSSKDGRDQFREDLMVLHESLTNIGILKATGTILGLVDEYTRGVILAIKTKYVPLWLVFGTRIFLDIHHILREEVDRPFTELTTFARREVASIAELQAFHKSFMPEDIQEVDQKLYNHLRKTLDQWVFSDMTESPKKSANVWKPEQRFMILKWNPLLSGMLLYDTKVCYEQAGIHMQTAWHSILSTAHLYNMLASENLLAGRWEAMEDVMDWHDELFVGDRPTKGEDYWKRWLLTMGSSATNFARDARSSRVRLAPGRGKEMKPVTNSLRPFVSRSSKGQELWWFSEEEIDRFVIRGMPEILPPETTTSSSSSSNNSQTTKAAMRKRWAKIGQLENVLLLEAIRNAVDADCEQLDFDYLTFHRKCSVMLMKIRRDCDDTLQQVLGYSNGGEFVPPIGVVADLFAAVSEIRSPKGKRELLEQAAGPVNVVIAAEKEAFERAEREFDRLYPRQAAQ
ncbi:hypothetical protein BJX61DRAFT_125262 [Aspergillus egyptiacus]|nr:hypothetical protein BJX61DRAFT_125262 [Aspergillus egyptiacus]